MKGWRPRTLAVLCIASVAGCGALGGADEAGDAGGGPDAAERPDRADSGTAANCPSSIPIGITPLGGSLSAHSGPNTGPNYVAIAIGDDQNPIVAWEESDGTRVTVNVRRWNGAAWQAMGPSIRGPNSALPGAAMPRLAAREGRVVLVWADVPINPGDAPLNAAEWDGTNWVRLGGPVAVGRLAGLPSLILDHTGSPVVAWATGAGATAGTPHEIRIARFDGTTWSPLGAPQSAETGPTDALDPALEVDDSGELYLAWSENDTSGTSLVHVRTLVGSQWQPLGSGTLDAVPGATPAYQPRLSVDPDGDLVGAWIEEGELHAATYSETWQPWSFSVALSVYPQMAVDRAGRLVTVGSDVPSPPSDPYTVRVRRSDGADFVLDPEPGDTDGVMAQMAIDGCDRINAVWREQVSPAGSFEVHAAQIYRP